MDAKIDRNRKSPEYYAKRVQFWSDKRISQLSFHNNLLITLSIATITLFWMERDSVYTKLVLDLSSSIDYKILVFVLGIILNLISLFLGFLLSLSRLYDLRLTANLAMTKKRLLEKGIDLKNEHITYSSIFTYLRCLYAAFMKKQKYIITANQIGNNRDELQIAFTELRQAINNLSCLTWWLLKYQTLFILASLILFSIVLIIK